MNNSQQFLERTNKMKEKYSELVQKVANKLRNESTKDGTEFYGKFMSAYKIAFPFVPLVDKGDFYYAVMQQVEDSKHV